MDYYYTSSLKYTSPVFMESNSSLRFKYDEASGTWLMSENGSVRDSLSELDFILIIANYAGLSGYWNVFDTDVEEFSDQGVVNYTVTTNVSGLECHKWTKEGRTDTVEKIVCSADGNDYLLSQKKQFDNEKNRNF